MISNRVQRSHLARGAFSFIPGMISSATAFATCLTVFSAAATVEAEARTPDNKSDLHDKNTNSLKQPPTLLPTNDTGSPNHQTQPCCNEQLERVEAIPTQPE